MASASSEHGKPMALLRLRSDQLLKVNKDGTSNIDEWSLDMYVLLKAVFGKYSSIILDGKIKDGWTEVPAIPNKEAEDAMSAVEKAEALSKYNKAVDLTSGWERAKYAMIPHIMCNISKESFDKIQARDKARYIAIVTNDEIDKLWSLLRDTHSIRDRDATKEEKRKVEIQLLTFKLESGELLTAYKTRWDNVIKKADLFEIKTSKADRFFIFVSGVKF